jgi:hypothetical protein
MANYVDQINLNGNIGDVKGCGSDRYYPGVDLTTKFASEISGYSDPWAWIKARISAGNYSKLHVGDYIPVTCTNGNIFNARIAGIDTYKGYGDSEIGRHIDFISASLWPTTFKMNPVNFNNGLADAETLTGDGTTTAFTLTKHFPNLTEVKVGGTATTAYTYDAATQTLTFTSAPADQAAIVATCATRQYPWLVSNGYHFLNSLSGYVPNGTGNNPELVEVDYTSGGVYYYLPDALKNVIVEKRLYLPKRYSASGIQSDDNNGGWANAGKLWLPSEFEVTGAPIWGSHKYGAMGFVQYPLFANNMNRMIGRYNWWTLSATSGYSTSFVGVYYLGYVDYYSASGAFRGPVCFRVA